VTDHIDEDTRLQELQAQVEASKAALHQRDVLVRQQVKAGRKLREIAAVLGLSAMQISRIARTG